MLIADGTRRVPLSRLLPRHSGSAQADEKSGFVEGADLRHPEISAGLQARDGRIMIIAQPLGFREFGRGAVDLAFEGVGGGEVGVNDR
jgi:hypothetical protein